MKPVYFAAFFLLSTSIPMYYGFSCSEGPPGKYCFDDLSGYHDCHVDKSGKMIDTQHTCPNGTRCVCFVGPACTVEEPCQKFRTPPAFPNKYSAYADTKTQIIGPQGPGPVSVRQTAFFQNLDENKFRVNKNYRNFYESSFYLPSSQGQPFNEYYVRWDKEQCNKTTAKKLPFFGVPLYFTYNGTVKFDWRVCEQWLWRTGGRHGGDSSTAEFWYICEDPIDHHYEPFRYDYRLYGSPMSKTNVVSNTTISFTKAVLDSEFDPPKYCSTSEFQIV